MVKGNTLELQFLHPLIGCGAIQLAFIPYPKPPHVPLIIPQTYLGDLWDSLVVAVLWSTCELSFFMSLRKSLMQAWRLPRVLQRIKLSIIAVHVRVIKKE